MRGKDGGGANYQHIGSSLSPTIHQIVSSNIMNQSNLDSSTNNISYRRNHDIKSGYDNNVIDNHSSLSSTPFFDFASSTNEMGRHKVQDPRY
jgi:hypothetical protein